MNDVNAVTGGIAIAAVTGAFGVLTAVVKVWLDLRKLKAANAETFGERLDTNLWKLIAELKDQRRELQDQVESLTKRVGLLEEERMRDKLRIVSLESHIKELGGSV